MKILAALLLKHPCLDTRTGVSIKVPNEPFMELTIESIGCGEGGRPALSICHYGEQNGDLMRDPEMCFEYERTASGFVFHPYYWHNDYVGVVREGREPAQVAAHWAFARQWDANLKSQGFLREIEAGKEVVNG